ncbi:MAG: hypothetical protein WCK32_04310 [Chlorobiaceae bacterium]
MPEQRTETDQASVRACLLRGFLVWLLIALAETVHGTLRTLLLKPIVGDLASRQIGVVTGSIMILLIACAATGWIGAKATRTLLAVGIVWFALMLCFEVVVGRAFGLSWQRIISDYLPWQGGFMIVGMTILALSPLIAVRLRSGLQNSGLFENL